MELISTASIQSLTIMGLCITEISLHRAVGDARGKPSRRAGYRDRHPVRAKEIVAKFLGETRSILEEKENFFSRWNVCLIQCDSFVQDVTMIHSPKEWEAYRETITITPGRNRFPSCLSESGRVAETACIPKLKSVDLFYRRRRNLS